MTGRWPCAARKDASSALWRGAVPAAGLTHLHLPRQVCEVAEEEEELRAEGRRHGARRHRIHVQRRREDPSRLRRC